MNRSVKLTYLLVAVLVTVHQARGSVCYMSVVVCMSAVRVGSGKCVCSLLCASGLSSSGGPGYYYTNEGDCVQLASNCTLSSGDCVFESQSVCLSTCQPCPHAASRDKTGHCRKSLTPPHSSHALTVHTPSQFTRPHSSHALTVHTPSLFTPPHCVIAGDAAAAPLPSELLGVRWDMISVGVVCSLLTVSVLTITGLTLLYRHKNTQRKRRYCLLCVSLVQMYNTGAYVSVNNLIRVRLYSSVVF